MRWNPSHGGEAHSGAALRGGRRFSVLGWVQLNIGSNLVRGIIVQDDVLVIVPLPDRVPGLGLKVLSFVVTEALKPATREPKEESGLRRGAPLCPLPSAGTKAVRVIQRTART